MITSMPELAKPEEVERIECIIRTSSHGEKRQVTFLKRHGLVDLGNYGNFWLGGKEVESYECHS